MALSMWMLEDADALVHHLQAKTARLLSGGVFFAMLGEATCR